MRIVITLEFFHSSACGHEETWMMKFDKLIGANKSQVIRNAMKTLSRANFQDA